MGQRGVVGGSRGEAVLPKAAVGWWGFAVGDVSPSAGAAKSNRRRTFGVAGATYRGGSLSGGSVSADPRWLVLPGPFCANAEAGNRVRRPPLDARRRRAQPFR